MQSDLEISLKWIFFLHILLLIHCFQMQWMMTHFISFLWPLFFSSAFEENVSFSNVIITSMILWVIFYTVRDAKIKHHRLGGLNYTNEFSLLQSVIPRSRCMTGFPLEKKASLSGLQMATFLPCPDMVFLLCSHWMSFPLLIRAQIPFD